jgi:hypothetical protein
MLVEEMKRIPRTAAQLIADLDMLGIGIAMIAFAAWQVWIKVISRGYPAHYFSYDTTSSCPTITGKWYLQ